MSCLRFSSVTFGYLAARVFEQVSFHCGPGERICVIGPNGAGKTTLLRLAANLLQPDSGVITRPDGVIGYYPADHTDCTVQEVLNYSCKEQLAVQQRFSELTALLASGDSIAQQQIADEYDTALTQMNALDVWDLPSNLARLLHSFGLSEVDPSRNVSSLSPGQQARLQLTTLFLSRPALMLLDEPTNHADKKSRAFLIEELLKTDCPVLFTSHDRDFINSVATSILDLDTEPWAALLLAQGNPLDNGVFQCAGNYYEFLLWKTTARKAHTEIYSAQQAYKQQLIWHIHASETIGHKDWKPRSESRVSRKFYADRNQKASTRRLLNDAVRLDRHSQLEVRKPRYTETTIKLPTPSVGEHIAVSVREVYVPKRLQAVSFELADGEHLLITGPNASGKSTLLRWLATGRQPLGAEGSMFIAGTIGYMPQSLPVSGLENELTNEQKKGFLHPKFWNVPFAKLSNGNQRRLQLASAFRNNPSVAIIDEPTNYLDLDAIESLESALQDWGGTLVLATHDPWLIKHWHGAQHIELAG
ncbi:putative ABC transporter ATP-binding protein YjjK [Corynebacterium freiburgense]|nr:putative ABC transporter ATP-binding protein YjjK [Corynebacterium freiburgense]